MNLAVKIQLCPSYETNDRFQGLQIQGILKTVILIWIRDIELLCFHTRKMF